MLRLFAAVCAFVLALLVLLGEGHQPLKLLAAAVIALAVGLVVEGAPWPWAKRG